MGRTRNGHVEHDAHANAHKNPWIEQHSAVSFQGELSVS